MAATPAKSLSPLCPPHMLMASWPGGGCSPTPSTDSCGLSPLYPLCQAPQEPCSSCPAAPSLVLTPRPRAGLCPAYGSRKGSRGRAGGGQRQSASEREKLRMRNLSKALHTLRRYLPPSVAPVGQSLTKIETLRLAIRYISHLSELLGLSEETLAQRREGPRRHCQLCPEGLGCCQATTPGLRAASPALWEGSRAPGCPVRLVPRERVCTWHLAQASPDVECFRPLSAQGFGWRCCREMPAGVGLVCFVMGLQPALRSGEPASGRQAAWQGCVPHACPPVRLDRPLHSWQFLVGVCECGCECVTGPVMLY
uniref:BHLH domain-containing protein n=1 Tax=Chelonoidis abingdonii TaxID=106734 RepID=A0A8C0IR93_CHEAB